MQGEGMPTAAGPVVPIVVDDEPLRVVTVRMPRSLHRRLKQKAHELTYRQGPFMGVSLNTLCVWALNRALEQWFLEGGSDAEDSKAVPEVQ